MEISFVKKSFYARTNPKRLTARIALHFAFLLLILPSLASAQRYGPEAAPEAEPCYYEDETLKRLVATLKPAQVKELYKICMKQVVLDDKALNATPDVYQRLNYFSRMQTLFGTIGILRRAL